MHKVIWTALPNGIRNGVASISMLASPRIDVDGRTGAHLEDFSEFTDWPVLFAGVTFDLLIKPGLGPEQSIKVATWTAPREQPDSCFWKSLFVPNMPVKGEEAAKAKTSQMDISTYGSTDGKGKNLKDLVDRLQSFHCVQLQRHLRPNALAATRSDLFWGQVRYLRDNPKFDHEQLKSNKVIPLEAFEKINEDVLQNSPELLERMVNEFQLFQLPLRALGQDEADRRTQTEEPPPIEFHEALSMAQEHRMLMRKLGIVLDFEFEVDEALVNKIGSKGRIRIEPKGFPIDDPLKPWTVIDLVLNATQDGTLGIFNPASGSSAKTTTASLQRLKNDGAEFFNFDVDTSLSDFVSLGHHLFLSQREHDDQFSAQTDPPEHQPMMRSAGILKFEPGAVEDLKRALVRSEELESKLQSKLSFRASGAIDKADDDEVLLYAEDLMRGFRVDVRDTDKGLWRSACRRLSEFTFLAPPLSCRPVWCPGEDEGEIGLAVAEYGEAGKSHRRISPYSWAWTGWSLVIPKPGKLTGDDGQPTVEDKTNSLRMIVASSVVPGSLLRKRYDHSYQFMSRCVDLAGNSWSTNEASLLSDTEYGKESVSPPIDNHRCESPGAPVVIAEQKLELGEKGDLLIIRNTDGPQACLHAERHILPPQISVEIAEEHGLFDSLTDRQAYQTIQKADGYFGQKQVVDDDNANWHVRKTPDGRIQPPFLPDPVVNGVALRDIRTKAFDKVEESTQQYGPVYFYKGKLNLCMPYNRQYASIRLILLPGKMCSEPRISRRGNTIYIRLAPGRKLTAKLSTVISQQFASSLKSLNSSFLREGLAHAAKLLGDKYVASDAKGLQDDLMKSASRGSNEMITPSRTMTFVHATQRPVLPPVFSDEAVCKRMIGESTAKFEDKGFQLDIRSTGRLQMDCEWDDIIDIPGTPDWTKTKRVIRAFEYELAEEDVSPLQPDSRESVNEITKFKDKRKAETQKRQVATAHNFNDTRYHLVKYTATAVSRFTEYFPNSLRETPGAMILSAASNEIHANNTAVPEIPYIDYIIPTFRRENDKSRHGDIHRIRPGGGLRIYMRRPWFSSGNGELLAVILTPHPPEMSAKEDLNSQFISQWGFNPRKLGGATRSTLILEDFRNAIEAGSDKAITLSLTSPDNKSGEPQSAKSRISYAAFNVGLDAEKDRIYCDVEIDPGQAFFPMVRLALARYQPHSEEGAHFSPVVLADFVQLTPNRGLTVTPQGRGSFEITVTGPSYVDVQFGKTTSVFEVRTEYASSLSREDELLWEPGGHGATTLSPRQIGGSEFVWHGLVECEPRLFRKRRLMVMEYEYFDCDAADRDLAKPAETTRRLIFAEAVELSRDC